MSSQDDDRRDGPADAEAAESADRDLVYVHGRQDDGAFQVIRARNQNVEVGVMRPPREGQPLIGELVKLEPTEEHEQVFTCETIAKGHTPPRAEGPAKSHPGPARVATKAYRLGWDAIFGGEDDDDGRGEPPDPSMLN